MLALVRATVSAITFADAALVRAQAFADGETTPRAIVAYPPLTGPLAVGDTVLLNTTATGLRLGTGGVDFVVGVENRVLPAVWGDGVENAHIIKLRYTPFQHAVASVEMRPEYHAAEAANPDLGQMPVVVCGLHSQIAPVAAAVKAACPHARVAYVMTDQAALLLAFSRLVRDLQSARLLDATLTAGQSFGGDYEAVSLPSALFAARFVAHADVTIVCQGPGNAGTGSRWGFAGVEQGYIVDMANQLGAFPVAVLRVSLADVRDRHYGISHHSTTALGSLSRGGATVAFPNAPPPGVSPEAFADLRETLDQSPIAARHIIREGDGSAGLALLAARKVAVSSMGRGVADDPMFFHAACAGGAVAAARLEN